MVCFLGLRVAEANAAHPIAIRSGDDSQLVRHAMAHGSLVALEADEVTNLELGRWWLNSPNQLRRIVHEVPSKIVSSQVAVVVLSSDVVSSSFGVESTGTIGRP